MTESSSRDRLHINWSVELRLLTTSKGRSSVGPSIEICKANLKS